MTTIRTGPIPAGDGTRTGTGTKVPVLAILILLACAPPDGLAQTAKTEDASPTAAVGDLASPDRKVHRAAARKLEAEGR